MGNIIVFQDVERIERNKMGGKSHSAATKKKTEESLQIAKQQRDDAFAVVRYLV